MTEVEYQKLKFRLVDSDFDRDERRLIVSGMFDNEWHPELAAVRWLQEALAVYLSRHGLEQVGEPIHRRTGEIATAFRPSTCWQLVVGVRSQELGS